MKMKKMKETKREQGVNQRNENTKNLKIENLNGGIFTKREKESAKSTKNEI